MSEISLVRIRVTVNGLPTDDLEMDVDKSQVHALRIALENAYAPFVSDLSKGES